MNQTLKRALTALFSLLLIVSAALSLPLAMDSVMAGSLTTQVVFAQAEAEEPETGNISPTPMPVVTLQPTCEVTPMEKNNALTPVPEAAPTPMPTPMPGSLTNSYNWRRQLAAADPARGQARLKAVAKNPAFPRLDEQTPFNFYCLDNNDDCLMAESQLSGSLVSQQIAKVILSYLENDPISIPESSAFESVFNLPLSGVILSKRADYALFLATHAQSLPFATLKFLSHLGVSRSVSQTAYLAAKRQLCAQARQLLENKQEAARQSVDLVKSLMNGDQPWNLLIMRMEAYACDQFWDYYLAGHHVRVMDMDTAQEYTITTDLVDFKVVGIATADIDPYLVVYENVLADAQTLQNLPEDEVAKAKETAIGLSKQLVEGDDLTNSDLWMISVTAFTNASKETHGWNISFSQTDEEARILDPSITSPPIAYTMVLDDEYHLVAWTASNIPQSAVGNAISIDRKGFDDFDETLNQFLQAEYMKDPAFIERVKLIVNNRDQIFQETHEKVEMLFPGATFSGVEQLYLEEQTYEGGMVITQVFFQPTFLTANGKTLSVSSLVKDDNTIQITGILDAANYDRIVTP
ncbi:MAG: hypothetical protein ACOX6O_04800 [Christensenellales bacterium]|jgi:hypothetical protein